MKNAQASFKIKCTTGSPSATIIMGRNVHNVRCSMILPNKTIFCSELKKQKQTLLAVVTVKTVQQSPYHVILNKIHPVRFQT